MSPERVIVVGVPYEVVVDDEDLDEGNEGECEPFEGQLKISRGAPARRWSKLRHEIGHAVVFEIGFKDRLTSEFGLSPDASKRLEEAMIGHFLPAFCDTLERAGWLVPPTIESESQP